MAENPQYDPPPGAAVVIGWLIFCGSLAVALYALYAPIAVPVPDTAVFGGGSVVNAGLVQDQSVRVMLGGFGMVSGLLMVVSGKIGELTSAFRASQRAKSVSVSVAQTAPAQVNASDPTDY